MPLEGINIETYWCARLASDREKSETCPFEDKLAEWTTKFRSHRVQFDEPLNYGGKIEYFI